MKKRIKKYLPYAFGEILLLVVGILAAFQIKRYGAVGFNDAITESNSS